MANTPNKKLRNAARAYSQLEEIRERVKGLTGNRKNFVEQMSQNSTVALELVMKKTNDYATIDDPYRNFRMCESVGVSVEKGILVRMCDKLSRIGNLIDNGTASVKDESVEDTLIDVMNYANILLCYMKSNK